MAWKVNGLVCAVLCKPLSLQLLAESILAKRRQNEFGSSSDIKSALPHQHASDSRLRYDLLSSRPEDAPASVGVSSKEVSQWS